MEEIHSFRFSKIFNIFAHFFLPFPSSHMNLPHLLILLFATYEEYEDFDDKVIFSPCPNHAAVEKWIVHLPCLQFLLF